MPTGPAAPSGTISGPVGQAWLTPHAPDFNDQLKRNLEELIARNNELVEAREPPQKPEFPGLPGVGDTLGPLGREVVLIAAFAPGGVVETLAGGAYRSFRGAQVAEGFAPMNSVLENGATVRFSSTATAIGEDADTLQNFARSRGAVGHDLVVHGTVIDGESQFLVNGLLTHPNQIAEAVLANPGYVRGVRINLVTCFGACGAAQELEAILGVPVNARFGRVDLDPMTGVLRDLWQ